MGKDMHATDIPTRSTFFRPASRRCLFADHSPAKTQLLDASKRDATAKDNLATSKHLSSKDPPGRQAVILIKARCTEQVTAVQANSDQFLLLGVLFDLFFCFMFSFGV